MVWLATQLACNQYELFVVAGGDGTRRSDKAEILFVIDNSASMIEETVGLAENFHVFIEQLTGREAGLSTDGLPGAVDQYIAIAGDSSAAVDYQLAITTTDATNDMGRLLGDQPIMPKGMEGLNEAFLDTLLCEATCFPRRDIVPSAPGYECGDPIPDEITQQVLDCTCGVDAWVGQCGAAAEEPLEAVLDVLCRSVEHPPASCFEAPSPLDPKLARSIDGFVRNRTTFVPVVVTDEGDTSRRTPTGEEVPVEYQELFEEIGVDMAWAVIAPALDEDFEVACPESAALSWGVIRLDLMVQDTGGLRVAIDGDDCGPTDWATSLERLGELVTSGISAFRLPREPVVSSIAVEVGTKPWGEAQQTGLDIFGRPAWSDGWTYDAAERTVVLHGEAIPESGDDVAIWFLPAPRGG
jgi:hypothetical protein